MTALIEYERKRARLAQQLAAARRSGSTIALKKSTSNLFRVRNGRPAARLDVRSLRRVLRIDPDAMVADVEGMTTYATAVVETLRYGLLPAVSPQLKTITVGGAVSGLGIESSSFRCGLVHETVEEMEVLLGDGSTVTCSPVENSDLFCGFPNSYGTLGYVLRLKIRLIAAKPFVRLRHTRFSDAGEYFSALGETCEDGSADFVDGTSFGPSEMYLSTGQFVDTAPFTSDYTWMSIYYKSIRERATDYLSALDYIWRWDTDWFWCSKHCYAQHALVRLLATRRLLNSATWQRLMRLSQRLHPDSHGTESVIQDVDIPIEHAEQFLCFLFARIGISPVWICPFRAGIQGRTYPLYALDPGKLYVNFGFWDVIPSNREPGYLNRLVEQAAQEFGGKKALYSSVWYDRETFWSIYNGPCYQRLKRKYDPGNVFPDLYQKCVENRRAAR